MNPGCAHTALRELLDAGHGPGLFGLVTQDGREVFSGAVGDADLDVERPIVAGDRFRVASLTKTYVAALVLLLDDQGVLSVTDPARRWLPEHELDPELTLAHLLRLRSGIPDYVSALLGDPPDIGVYRRYHAPEQLVRLALSLPGRTPPGQSFRYSNTDYLLLGLAIERATGQRLDAQLWQQVFQPLGLRDTELPTVDPAIRGPHATGYVRLAAGSPYVAMTEITPSESWASGAVISTPWEVARFLESAVWGRLLPDRQSEAMRDTQPVDHDRGYGFGLYRIRLPDGRLAYGHRGGTPGYNTLALTTETGRTVVLYRNSFEAALVLAWDNPFVVAALAPTVADRDLEPAEPAP